MSDPRVLQCFRRVWDARKLDSIPVRPTIRPSLNYFIYYEQVLDSSLDFDFERIDAFCGSRPGKACRRGEFIHGKSVSSAYWDPRGRSVVSTSYDDTLRRMSSLLLNRTERTANVDCYSEQFGMLARRFS